MVTLFPCVGKSHKEVIQHLRIYLQMYPGIREIVSDNYFVSPALTDFFAECNIKHLPTPAYRPCANGPTERVNRELRKLLPQLVEDLDVPWNEWSRLIPLCAQILNSTPHSVTRFTPEMLHFGTTKDDLFQEFQEIPGNDNSQAHMWRIARSRMEKARKQNFTIKAPKNFPDRFLEKGVKIWANLKIRIGGEFLHDELMYLWINSL